MRAAYLLAVGLLTGLAIPASALTQMSIFLPETSRLLWDFKQGSQIIVDEKNITNPEISSPEPLLDLHSQVSHLPLTSGNQLYDGYDVWRSALQQIELTRTEN